MKVENDKLVSIITPTYNPLQFIDETIHSILNQTCQDWELLITDDCSTDGTWDLLEKYAEKDKRIKIFRLEKNSGAGIARNNSFKPLPPDWDRNAVEKRVKGEFVVCFEEDDRKV